MTVDFRCESCGKLLSVEARPGERTKCPHCQKLITVPAGLASLPRPQVPPGAAPNRPTADAAPPAPEEEPEPMPTRSSNAVSMLMSAVISLFFHVGLALVCLFVTFIVIRTSDEVRLPPPNAFRSDERDGSLTRREVTMDRSGRVSKVKTRRRSAVENPIPIDAGKTSKRLVIGLGGAAGTGGKNWFVAGGGGARSSFFGLGGGGITHHVVYVIDRSGSMHDTFDFVRKEMVNSIGRLRPVQDFHAIFFNIGPPLENTPRRLVPATRENKEDVAHFLDKVIAQGRTDPVPALNQAFEVLARANSKPGKVVYLLTDGDFPNNKQVLTALARKNVKKEVRINTYLYEYRGPLAVEIMERIAKENRGEYKYVSLD